MRCRFSDTLFRPGSKKKENSLDTQALILIGVSLYIVLMMLIGIWASRGNHSLADFTVAGRNMPLWLCTVSVFATWFGSGIMMGAATAAYEYDLLLMVGEPFASGLCLFLIGLIFARIVRRTRRLTWPEFFEARYGKVAATFAAVSDVISGAIWLGGLLFTFGVLLQALAGVPLAAGIVGGTVVVAAYTMIGGMWAVAMTDFVQMTVFVVGLVVLLFVVLADAGGWGAVSAQLPANAMRLIPLEHTFIDWMQYIQVWMTLGVAAVASSSVIQRALSASSERVAQYSFYLATVAYVIIGSIPLLLGLVASVEMPGVEDPNAILTELALSHLHPVLVAVFVGAIVSAGMSSCDSILLAGSTVVSTNLMPLVVRKPSDQLRLRVVRYTIPVLALGGMYIAFNATRAVQVLIDSVSILLAGICVPFFACFFWSKANRTGAVASIASGLVTWQIASTYDPLIPPDLIGFFVSFAVMIVVTLATQESDPPRPLTDIDGEPVALENRL